MPVLRNHTMPKTPEPRRIARLFFAGQGGPNSIRTQRNTPESPTLRIQANRRALRREPSVIFTRSMTAIQHATRALVEADNSQPSAVVTVSNAPNHSLLATVNRHTSMRFGGQGNRSFEDIVPTTIPSYKPYSRLQRKSEYRQLLELDCFTGGGLSEDRFRRLFVRCRTCCTYMMRGTVTWHQCGKTGVGGSTGVIDLTGDDLNNSPGNTK